MKKEGFCSSTPQQTTVNTIHLKRLEKPAALKLVTGKKRVTIRYKEVPAATAYQICRSTKKSSGYKVIATTTSTKYVDKTAKKGKKYYYKVRSVRNTSGIAKSGFTTPKNSGKVR